MHELADIAVDYFRLLERYRGRWVAIRLETQEVIAAGDSPKEVLDSALAQGAESPFITKVDSENYLVPCATA